MVFLYDVLSKVCLLLVSRSRWSSRWFSAFLIGACHGSLPAESTSTGFDGLRSVVIFEPMPGGSGYFRARGPSYDVLLGPSELIVSPRQSRSSACEQERERVRIRFPNADPFAALCGENELAGKTHYFRGNDPNRWRVGVPNFAGVRSEEIFPGIDLVYYGRGASVEFDFVVAPGVDPDAIEVEVDSPYGFEVDAGGNLVIDTARGHVLLRRPHVYQEMDDGVRVVDSRYVATDSCRVTFDIGDYDTRRALVIDPVLEYGSRIGGTGRDEVTDLAGRSAGRHDRHRLDRVDRFYGANRG